MCRRIKEGADVNIAPDIWTPLILALRTGRTKIAAMLLELVSKLPQGNE
jgi:hypothetical protein